MATGDRPAAAPPDAAGHEGTSTIPAQTLATADQAGDGPPLNEDPSRGVGTAPASKALAWVFLGALLLFGILFYVLLGG